MTRLNRRYLYKYMKNPLIASSAKEILYKIRPLIEKSWVKTPQYNNQYYYNDKTHDVDNSKKYTLVAALEEVESNISMRDVLEAILGIACFGTKWWGSEDSYSYKSLYTFNYDQLDNKPVLEAIDKAIRFVTEKESAPKRIAVRHYIKAKRKLPLNMPKKEGTL